MYICVYNITLGGLFDKETLECIRDKVRIITDQGQMKQKYVEKFTNDIHEMDIPIKFNIIAKHYLHCKFIVIDDWFVLEGSMNMGK